MALLSGGFFDRILYCWRKYITFPINFLSLIRFMLLACFGYLNLFYLRSCVSNVAFFHNYLYCLAGFSKSVLSFSEGRDEFEKTRYKITSPLAKTSPTLTSYQLLPSVISPLSLSISLPFITLPRLLLFTSRLIDYSLNFFYWRGSLTGYFVSMKIIGKTFLNTNPANAFCPTI